MTFLGRLRTWLVRFKPKERLVSDYVPLVGHATDGALLLDDSSAYAMLELVGLPWETADPSEIVGRHLRLNHTYRNIASDTLIVSIYQVRVLASPDIYPIGKFRSAFAESLDASYREKLFERSLYENRLFMGMQVRPHRYAGEFVGEQMTKRQKVAEEAPEDRLRRLEDICALLAVELADYKPRRLSLVERGGLLFSEIAEALVLALTGKWRPIGLTTGRLGNAMFSERIIVGREAIEYRLPGESWYAAAFGQRQFPHQTHPLMFSGLLAADYQYCLHQSFRFIATQAAQDIMKRKQVRLIAANDPAESQVEALREAADLLGQSDFVFGDYSLSLLVFASSTRKLQDVATAAWTDLANGGVVVARENTALEAALFSMLPGNARLRPRPGYISSRNFASMCPLHNFPTGERKGFWGEPIALFRTTAGTPYFFHFQPSGSDVGNMLVTGETGSGKTLFVGTLLTMTHGRARIVALDHKRGWEMLIRSMGGAYAVLGGGQPHFAPLKALDATPRNMEFLTELLRGCILMDDGRHLTPEEDRRLALALQIVMSMPAQDRCLSEVKAFLGVDENGVGARLAKWCHGNELGWVIDAPTDVISLNGTLHGLDTTALLENPRARGPSLLYLFHRIEMMLDGSPILIPNDEGWRALLDKTFRPMIDKRLRTIRSFGGAFVFITQSPRDIIDSGIAATLIEQCPTQIHMPNRRSAEDDYVLGLKRTKAEFNVLHQLPWGQGFFLLCQGGNAVVAQLPLHGLTEEIATLSGREADIRALDTIREQEDDDMVAVKQAVRKKEDA